MTGRLFQFHKGTIRTYGRVAGRVRILHFNSIKVRLEPRLFCRSMPMNSDFNSIKVRLEPAGASDGDYKSQVNFNSIKVRLEHGFFTNLQQIISFQFHKGTIRTTIH